MANSEFDALNAESATTLDRQVQELQDELAHCKEQQTGERFVWIAVVMILFDALVLSAMKSWSGLLAIFAMQVLLLVVFARRYGVNELAASVDQLVAMAKAATPGHTKP